MKLITKTNMSCQDLNIHKSKEVIIITQESKIGITYCSMVLATNEMMAFEPFVYSSKTQFKYSNT
jgi:hypothetical protein